MSNIDVVIRADVADFQAKLAVAKAESQALTGELTKLARQAASTGLNDTLKPQLLAAAESSVAAKEKLAALSAEMNSHRAAAVTFGSTVSASLREAFVPILAGGAAIEGLHLLRDGFDAVVQRAQDFGIESARFAAVLGVDQGQAVGLSGALRAVGASTDDYISMALKLERQVKTNEAALNSYGMKTRDANGDLLNGKQLMENAISTMQTFKAGTDQNEFALSAFGRGAAEVYTIMRAGRDLQSEYNKTLQEFGVDVGPKATGEALAMEKAHARLSAQVDALKIRLGQDLIPALINTLDFMRKTGIVEGFANSVEYVGKAADYAGAGLAVLEVGIETTIRELVDASQVLGKAAVLDFGGAAASVKDAWAHMTSDAQNGAARIQSIVQRLQADLQGWDLHTNRNVADTQGDDEGDAFQSGHRSFVPFEKGKTGNTEKAKSDYRSMLEDIMAATMQSTKEIIDDWNAVNDGIAKGANEAAQDEIKRLQTLAQFHVITGNEELAQERAIEDQRFAAVQAAINREIIADKERIAKTEENEREHQKRLSEIDDQALHQRLEKEQQFANDVIGFQSEIVSGVFSGQQKLGQIVQAAALHTAETLIQRKLAALTQTAIIDNLFGEKEVATTAATEAAKTQAAAAGEAARAVIADAGAGAKNVVQAAAASKSIDNDAFATAASAFRSVMQTVPPPFNLVAAPLAASGAFLAVEAYNLVSARDGLGRVEIDGQLAELHRNETVLPADIAVPLTDFARSGALTQQLSALSDMVAVERRMPAFMSADYSSQVQNRISSSTVTNNSNRSGGDIHFSLNMPVTINGRGGLTQNDLDSALRNHASTIRSHLRNEYRNGYLNKP